VRRRGFTLLELLVIIGIISTMVAVSVLSVRQGQGAARLQGSARDLLATIRHARSVAMTSEEPSIITYSTESVDGEVCAKIEITSSKKLSGTGVSVAETLGGRTVELDPDSGLDGEEGGGSFSGITAGDIMFAPVSEDILRGVRLKVEFGGEEEAPTRGGMKRSNVSIFSNVEFLLGRYDDAKKSAAAEKKAAEASGEDGGGSASKPEVEELQEPVRAVWQVNGRCDPHRVWVYLDGTEREKGLVVDVDMFGAARVLTPDELEKL
jgi:type II secretory pathway pseudopilin PulG